jgi:nucleotide-binding universal stress UspA family protein
MKTILVPTDFSDHALYALKVAAFIAKRINAVIKVVHVCSMPAYEFAESYYYEEYCAEIKARAEKKLNMLVEMDFLRGIEISKHFVSIMLMWELVNDERFKHADLIVIGSHGKSGFHEVFIGSNTEKIVRLADAPVLTIKKEVKDFDIKRIQRIFSCQRQEKIRSICVNR